MILNEEIMVSDWILYSKIPKMSYRENKSKERIDVKRRRPSRRRRKSQLYACHFEHHGDGQLSKIKLLYRHRLSSSSSFVSRYVNNERVPLSKDVNCATALFPNEVC